MNSRGVLSVNLIRNISKSFESSYFRRSSSNAFDNIELKSDSITESKIKNVVSVFVQIDRNDVTLIINSLISCF